MSSRIHSLCFVVISLSAPLLVAGCTGVDRAPQPRDRDPRIEKLVVGMDQCLAGQAQAAEQLQQQQEQLQRQQRQLVELTGAVDSAARLAAGEVVPAEPANDACGADTEVPDKVVIGQLEQVWLQNLQLALPARIDTGAETASLDARNIELFERDGRRWVRFEILHPQSGEPLPVERKLKRMVVILQSNTAESERRPVIKMGITLGHISQTAEFTLSNRSHLDYQVLVGRNILKDFMVVDVSRENIAPFTLPEESAGSEATP